MPKGNLNALLNKPKPSWASKTESRVNKADTKFELVLIDNLVLNPNNQNYNANDDKNKIPFEELVASIKLVGIRQPLDVEAMGGNKYMIISGERRFRAAKEARLKVVPCVIKTSESELIQTIAKNVTNLMVRELSVEQKYRGYCEIRDAIEKEGKSVDDPEFAHLFQLTDKKSKKLFKKFEMIRRLTNDVDYERFLKGELSYSSIEESAEDMEQAIKMTKKVNELLELYAETKTDVDFKVYTDDDGFIFYVTKDERLNKYIVIERDCTKNVEGHRCRSSYLPPSLDKKVMQTYLDRFAVANNLKKLDESEFETLVDKAKGIIVETEAESQFDIEPSEISVSSDTTDDKAINFLKPILDVDESVLESKPSIKSEPKSRKSGSEVESRLNREKKAVSVEMKKDNITPISSESSSDVSTEAQIDILEEKDGGKSNSGILFEFEGEEISTGQLIRGALARCHERIFIIRGNLNLNRNRFTQRGIPSLSASCVVVEVKPESIRMISR